MTKAVLTLDQVQNFCVFDRKPIPVERVKRNATTCSKECAKAMERQRMLLMEQSECKYCRRPSTPAERESYKRWRQWVKEQTTAKDAEEITGEITEREAEVAKETEDWLKNGMADVSKEYPAFYTGSIHGRKGQRCKLLLNGRQYGSRVQVQFEDGTNLIVEKMCLSSGRPKKYLEKRGRPRKSESTLAPKQQISEPQESKGE